MSVAAYTEADFEDHVAGRLVAHGYRPLAPAAYRKDLCLVPGELLAFLRATQPKAVDALAAQYGAAVEARIAERVASEAARRGALDVLRHGVKDRGQTLRLVYARPASGLNPEHARLCAENRFGVVRQLRYSARSENSLDLALFVNGLPFATAELKNSLTGQAAAHAERQYRKDRDPKEPLLAFKRCLVHFAVGNERVAMTTHLAGEATRFLPFNRGTENPVNPHGHRTAYLWDDVLRPATVLDLLHHYLHAQQATERVFDPALGAVVERTREALVFPRFHQLDVVRKLLAAARADGTGHAYLVQHSAGSGKSNSIAWLAHGLAALHRADDERLFDTVVVVTDRKVLDGQLQKTIKGFEQVKGVVVPIDATSAQLRSALEGGKDIVITTLQKFPVISDVVTELAGRRFAVILDEAHSGQSGESAKHLTKTLSVGLEDAEAAEAGGEEPSLEDRIADEVRARRKAQPHLSYFAFTATPKNKTLELFGRRGADGRFEAFHTYTMRQAIEEGFILDVLRGYATYKRYFKLAKALEHDERYERPKAVRALTAWVDLTDHAVDTKAGLMLDHFGRVTEKAIQGRGRAFVVTRSRLHAVRYFLALRRLMRDADLSYGPLVAFSGTVRDPATGIDHTEASLNALSGKTSIPDAFKLPAYRVLVVANKFQTGFDEPLLHTMYVDRKLGGLQAVQTLSRLNRTMRGKTDTAVLDFVNEADEIREAFQPYYESAYLEEETDPNKLYALAARLAAFEVYDGEDVARFAAVFYDEASSGERLQPVLDRVVDAWRVRDEAAREDFRGHLQAFVRLYAYVSQLVSFVDADLERLYVFARNLALKLPRRENDGLPAGVTDAVDLDSFRVQRTYEGALELEAGDAALAGIPGEGAAALVQEPETDYLSNIVRGLNDLYGADLTERDRVRVNEIVAEVEADASVRAVLAGNNSAANKRAKVDAVIDRHIMGQVNTSIELFKKLTDPRTNAAFKARLYDHLVRLVGFGARGQDRLP